MNRLQHKDKCDALIRKIVDLAGVVRGTKKGAELRSCIQWRMDIYQLTTQDQHAAPYIYAELKRFIEEDIRVNFVEPCKTARDIFSFVATFFRDFKVIARAINFAFAYLDQYFTKRAGFEPVLVSIYRTFQKSGYNVIKADLLDSIMSRMNAWRDGEQQNLNDLRVSIDFFQTIGLALEPSGGGGDTKLKNTTFERDFLDGCISRSRLYYKHLAAKRQSTVSEEGVPSYYAWVESQLTREENLMKTLDLTTSWISIKEGLIVTLVGEHHAELLKDSRTGFVALLTAGRSVLGVFNAIRLVAKDAGIETLASMYNEFMVDSITRLFSTESATSTTAPPAAGEKAEDGDQKNMRLVMDMLRTQRDEVIPQQLGNNAKLLSAWSMGVTAGLRLNTKVPRLLSDHMDAYLSRASTNSEDDTAEADLFEFYKNVFACVTQKDEFFANYKGALARRLLRGQFRRTSEAQMIARLKLISGNADVYPLNAMVADIDNSDKLSSDMLGSSSMASFIAREKLKARTILITSQYWPTVAYMDDMRPAPVIADFIALFESFYTARFPNRRVRWVYQSSVAVVSVRFVQSPKELSGSLIQATILLLLDGTSGMRIPELVDATGLPKESVADAVASMYMNKKVNVLSCVDPATGALVDVKRLSDPLVFKMNADFKAPVRKLDLPKPRAAKGIDMKQIDNLRKQLADIAIVRFMKSRGSAMYHDLMEGALSDLRRKFDAQPPLVKAQLEDLIVREFVRRDEKDPKHLIYIA